MHTRIYVSVIVCVFCIYAALGQGSSSVVLDLLVAWWFTWLKKVVIVLYWWPVVCVCVCVANIETHTLTENHHVSWKNIKSIKSSNSKSIIGISWTSFAMLGSPYSSIGLTWELWSKIACFVCLFSSLFATSPWLLYIISSSNTQAMREIANYILSEINNQWERDWALARIQRVTIHQAIAVCHVHRRPPCGPLPCRRKIKTIISQQWKCFPYVGDLSILDWPM